MNDELDKVSKKALKSLYKSDMDDLAFCALIGWSDRSQPNEVEQFLRAEGLIAVHVDGFPDGEGGYVDDTVIRTYSIKRRGRVAVEQMKLHRVDTLFRILEAIPHP